MNPLLVILNKTYRHIDSIPPVYMCVGTLYMNTLV